MLSRFIFRLTGSLLLSLACVSAFAQQFSADMVRTKPEGSATSRVFVSGDHMRFEVKGQPQEHTAAVVLNLKQDNGFMVLAENKSYVVMPSGSKASAMPFFTPADPDNACPAWEKLVSKPGSCTKVGPDTVGGRDAVKYKGTAANGDTGNLWVDRKLNFVVKWEGEKGAAEFRDIQEGPQAASLFEVPKGYDKVDPQAAHKEASKARSAKGKTITPPKPSN